MPGNIGDFKELIESNKNKSLFVDKTLFIQEIINSQKDPLLITRPRRWGKTLNLNMLFYYFVNREQLQGMGKANGFIKECNDLFQSLNIFNQESNPNVEEVKKHLGKYPSIFISFALSGDDASKGDITKPDWEKIKGLIVGRIGNLFAEFGYIAEDLKRKIEDEFYKKISETIAREEKTLNCILLPEDKKR